MSPFLFIASKYIPPRLQRKAEKMQGLYVSDGLKFVNTPNHSSILFPQIESAFFLTPAKPLFLPVPSAAVRPISQVPARPFRWL